MKARSVQFAATWMALVLAGSVIPGFVRQAFNHFRPPDRLQPLPRLLLWAWERPEDLRFLPRGVGVAFLAETVTLRGGEVLVRPRQQALLVAPDTLLVACARLETDRKQAPILSPGLASTTSSAIAQLASLRGVRAVQVDFDATVSERTFYADLL